MQTFDSISAASAAIIDFRVDHLAKLPAEMQDRYKASAASPSPVDQIVGVMDLLYANRDIIGDDGKSLAGGLASYAAMNGWHGLTVDDRGNRIVQAMRRDLGETPPSGASWPDAADDPAAVPGYIVTPPQPEQPDADATKPAA